MVYSSALDSSKVMFKEIRPASHTHDLYRYNALAFSK